MDRTEHLQWCKNRAIEYVDVGDIGNAVTSFISDMGKHPETATHVALPLLSFMLLSNRQEVKKFILDFN